MWFVKLLYHECVWFAGDLVAHIKFTVLLMPNGSDRITSHSLQELQPTKTIEDPEIKAWLALGTKSKKKGGGKKKKGELDSLLLKPMSLHFSKLTNSKLSFTKKNEMDNRHTTAKHIFSVKFLVQ